VSKISFVSQCLATVVLSSNHRISVDFKKKLQGCSLFWEKHSDLINRSPKLRHRAASRVFVFAIVLFDIDKIKKCFYWALLGLFIDPKNFVWMMRSTISFFIKARLNKKIL
jgi:hypothetical protein